MIQEFPKCLYLGGDVLAVYCVAMTPQDEAKARKEGYSSIGESQAKAEPVKSAAKSKRKAG